MAIRGQRSVNALGGNFPSRHSEVGADDNHHFELLASCVGRLRWKLLDH
jgi:hypothetical protein